MASRRAALWTATIALSASCAEFSPPHVERTTPPDATAQCSNADTDPTHDVDFDDEILGDILLREPPLYPGCYCHLPTSAYQPGLLNTGLNLSSYATLRLGGAHSGSNIVVPGRPCSSVLYRKLLAPPPFGARMPAENAPLPDEMIRRVHDWIAEGARED